MHGSYNRFTFQDLIDKHDTEMRKAAKVGKGPSKFYRSENDPNKPGSSIDVEVNEDGSPIEAATKLEKELKLRAFELDALPGTANGGEIVPTAYEIIEAVTKLKNALDFQKTVGKVRDLVAAQVKEIEHKRDNEGVTGYSCPFCRRSDTTSADSVGVQIDREYVTLLEYQCQDCGHAFWV